MRIISQDGYYDLPYDAVAIRYNEFDTEKIVAVPLEFIVRDLVYDIPVITLGRYSTEKKAKKALEMLHSEYGKVTCYPFSSKNDIIPPKIFQFPADDEVEV